MQHCTLSIRPSDLIGHEFLLSEYLPRRISGLQMEISFLSTCDNAAQEKRRVLTEIISELEGLHMLQNIVLIEQVFASWNTVEDMLLGLMKKQDIVQEAEIWKTLTTQLRCCLICGKEDTMHNLEHLRTIQVARSILTGQTEKQVHLPQRNQKRKRLEDRP